jgi:hypothetical protein
MDFYTKFNKPSKEEVLTGAIPNVAKRMKVQYSKLNKDKIYKYYDFINPDFEEETEELKYTDKVTHKSYKSIYEKEVKATKYNLKQFIFDTVVYDEIEYFPKDIRNTRFTYPFVDQKTLVDKLELNFDGTEFV